MTGPGVGAVLAYVVVAVLLLTVSPLLAAVVLLGVPVLAVLVGPLLGRLQGAEPATASGRARCRPARRPGRRAAGPQRPRRQGRLRRPLPARLAASCASEGYRVGAVTSWIQALGVGLPTLFLAAGDLAGGPDGRRRATITVGELVAVYGYVAVLVVPVSFFIEGGYDISRGLVAARQVIRFLRRWTRRRAGGGPDADRAVLHDPSPGSRWCPAG